MRKRDELNFANDDNGVRYYREFRRVPIEYRPSIADRLRALWAWLIK